MQLLIYRIHKQDFGEGLSFEIEILAETHFVEHEELLTVMRDSNLKNSFPNFKRF